MYLSANNMLISNICLADKYKNMSLLVYIISSNVYPNHPVYDIFPVQYM